MKEDKDKLIGAALARGLVQSGTRGEAGTDHPDPETIAAVVEGIVHGDERDGILKHISACDTCYDTFLLTAELQRDGESKKEKSNIISFKPLALAASILIVVFSIYVFYRSGDIPKTPRQLMEKSEAMKASKALESTTDEVTYAKKGAPAEKEKGAPAKTMKVMPVEKPVEESVEVVPRKKAEPVLSAPAPKKGGAPAKKSAYRATSAAKEEKKIVRKKGDVGKARVVDTKDTEDTEEKDRETEEGFQQMVQREEVRTNIAEQRVSQPKQKQVAPVSERSFRYEYPPVQTQAVALNTMAQKIPSYIPQKDIGKIFKEALTLSRQMGKEYETVRNEATKTGNYSLVDSYVSGLSPLITVKTVGDTPHIAPNIHWFLSRSDPRTVEHRFFALARSGWCDTTDLCYDLREGTHRVERDMVVKRAKKKGREDVVGTGVLLTQWQALQPGLKGVFKRVAHQTIINLEKTQR